MKITHYKNIRRRKTKHYHVSYNFLHENGTGGFGHIELRLNGSFKLSDVTEYIKSTKSCFKSIVIISWQEKMK